MNKKANGFTLVELLIVIVIIAILAAITMVSYNSIQRRAYNTAAIAAARDAVNLMSIAHIDRGQIYLEHGVPHGGDVLCIGGVDDFPAEGPYSEGQCTTNAGYASDELWDILSSYGNGSFKLKSWYDGNYNHIRGIMYYPARYSGDSKYYDFLVYSLMGKNQNCSVSGAVDVDDLDLPDEYSGPNETWCWVDMYKTLGQNPIDW